MLAHAPVAARRAAALGAHREAAAQYARALRFADGLARAALAELLEGHSYGLEGDPAAARAAVEDALDLAERTDGYAWLAGELAFWLWRLGGPNRLPVSGLAESAAEPFALQMAGDRAAAANRWRALGCPYEAAAALADGDQEPQLRAALTELERLGARPLAAAVARKLRELGVRGLARGPRPTTRANPANLTARELEVLGLLVEGRSNCQVAEQLFISNKTASVHVTNLLAKLGAHSRLEAAAMARRLGLEQPTDLEN